MRVYGCLSPLGHQWNAHLPSACLIISITVTFLLYACISPHCVGVCVCLHVFTLSLQRNHMGETILQSDEKKCGWHNWWI